MIPQELMQQWEKEAVLIYGYTTSEKSWANEIRANKGGAYIRGRTDQYLQMQPENERLKGLLEDAYNLGYHVRMECEDKPGNEKSFIKATSFNKFKTEHNL